MSSAAQEDALGTSRTCADSASFAIAPRSLAPPLAVVGVLILLSPTSSGRTRSTIG